MNHKQSAVAEARVKQYRLKLSQSNLASEALMHQLVVKLVWDTLKARCNENSCFKIESAIKLVPDPCFCPPSSCPTHTILCVGCCIEAALKLVTVTVVKQLACSHV